MFDGKRVGKGVSYTPTAWSTYRCSLDHWIMHTFATYVDVVDSIHFTYPSSSRRSKPSHCVGPTGVYPYLLRIRSRA